MHPPKFSLEFPLAVVLVVIFALVAFGTPNAKEDVPTLDDFWDKRAHFALIQPAPVIPGQGHREAFAVLRPDIGAQTIYLYYRCRTTDIPPRYQICLAISSDNGASYPVDEGVMIAPDNNHPFAVAPSVAKVRDRWVMVYEEGGSPSGTLWAESADGIRWSKKGALLSNDRYYKATPSLYQYQDSVYVFYALGNPTGSNHLSISYSVGQDMNDLHPYANGNIFTGKLAWDKGSVSMPRIIFDGATHWLFFEGATQDQRCEGNNVYGWGIAKSTDLITWLEFPDNPIAQSNDGQSCGMDLPQPFRLSSGAIAVYHTSDDVTRILMATLQFGSACLGWQTNPNWKEKNYQCTASCGGLGGVTCQNTKTCANASRLGTSWDCASCCK